MRRSLGKWTSESGDDALFLRHSVDVEFSHLRDSHVLVHGRTRPGGRCDVRSDVLTADFWTGTVPVAVRGQHGIHAGGCASPAQGLLGINAGGAWASTLFQHDNDNGEAQVSFPIPNALALSGVRLPIQSATLEVVSGTVYLGNTALPVVE